MTKIWTFDPWGGKKFRRTPRQRALELINAPAPGPANYITFNIVNSSQRFSALADVTVGAPTITGGYAKWNTIDRPRRSGLTTFAGYDPVELTIPILFDNFIAGDAAEVQDAIILLEKMAGRGPNSDNVSSKTDSPPRVQILGEMLPKVIRGSDPPVWIIVGIEWDAASIIYNVASHIVRASATVRAQQYVAAESLKIIAGKPEKSASGSKTVLYNKGTTMRDVERLQRCKLPTLKKLNQYGKNAKLDAYLRDKTLKFKKPLNVKVPRV